jgi:hypothetical protein
MRNAQAVRWGNRRCDIALSIERLNPGGSPSPDTPDAARIIRAYKLRQLADPGSNCPGFILRSQSPNSTDCKEKPRRYYGALDGCRSGEGTRPPSKIISTTQAVP